MFDWIEIVRTCKDQVAWYKATRSVFNLIFYLKWDEAYGTVRVFQHILNRLMFILWELRIWEGEALNIAKGTDHS